MWASTCDCNGYKYKIDGDRVTERQYSYVHQNAVGLQNENAKDNALV